MENVSRAMVMLNVHHSFAYCVFADMSSVLYIFPKNKYPRAHVKVNNTDSAPGMVARHPR